MLIIGTQGTQLQLEYHQITWFYSTNLILLFIPAILTQLINYALAQGQFHGEKGEEKEVGSV